jgi:hypothetical protein
MSQFQCSRARGVALAPLFRDRLEVARRTGRDQRCPLRGGATFAVRVRNGIATITVYRTGKPLGDGELIVFHTQFAVPAAAQRIPAEGQGQREGKHYVAWRWSIADTSDTPDRNTAIFSEEIRHAV